MLALSALATILALVVAGAAMFGVLQRFVTQGLDQRLDAQLSLLATAVQPAGTIDRPRLDQIQAALATDSGWRWRIGSAKEVVSSQDFPALDTGPPRPPGPEHEPRRLARPGEAHGSGGQRLHVRSLTVPSAAGPVILTAAAPWAVVSRPISGALVPLLAALAFIGLALGGAAIVQLRLGLRPLRRLREDVAAVRIGALRSVSEDQPDELRPLATELNALLSANASALAVARASAANLAHALKTPVATLALELRDDPERTAQVDRLYATIRHHLSRARNSIADARATTPMQEVLDDLVVVIARIHGNRVPIMVRHSQPAAIVAMDRSDLEEMLGNLIDNAARHALARVAVETSIDDRHVRVTVVDDGPGIALADRIRATTPGVRLDERADGDGFGLSIARDLAELHGGRLTLEEAPGGGLIAMVEVVRAADPGR